MNMTKVILIGTGILSANTIEELCKTHDISSVVYVDCNIDDTISTNSFDERTSIPFSRHDIDFDIDDFMINEITRNAYDDFDSNLEYLYMGTVNLYHCMFVLNIILLLRRSLHPV